MRERTNRTVSKTVVSQGTVGSNPTPSASSEVVFRFGPGSPDRGPSLMNPSLGPRRVRLCPGRNAARAITRRMGATCTGGTRLARGQAPAGQQGLPGLQSPGVQGTGQADDQLAGMQLRRRQQDGQGPPGPVDRTPGRPRVSTEDNRRLPIHRPSPARTCAWDGQASAFDSLPTR